ncbi:MAG: hypothetical protein WA063_04265, partial [Minisyncoccia bacterium]
IEQDNVSSQTTIISGKIINECLRVAQSNLAKFKIYIDEIAFSAIDLPEDLEEARNKVFIEEKKLEAATIGKKTGTQEGLRVRNRLKATVSDEEVKDENGNVIKSIPSGLSMADAMNYEIALKTAEKVENINILSSGGGGEGQQPFAMDIAARMGAAFKTGSNTIKDQVSKERSKQGKEIRKEIKGGKKENSGDDKQTEVKNDQNITKVRRSDRNEPKEQEKKEGDNNITRVKRNRQ